MIGANVSAFSIGKAVGRGGGAAVPLLWNQGYGQSSGLSIIAQQSGSSIRFGVPSNSPTFSGIWQYQQSGGSSWNNFGGPFTVIDTGAEIIQVANGSAFRYIFVSSNWTAGNTSFTQRYRNNGINTLSYGETAALNNNAGNFGTPSNYSFF